MKTKLFLALMFIFNAFVAVSASEEDVKIYHDPKQDESEEKRSLSVLPSATYDENVLYIYTDIVTNDVTVTIKDEMGNVIYSDVDSASSQCHVFLLSGLSDSCFLLEIEIGEDFYYGYF